jgi:adenine phosphoribosyltransferase
MHSDAIRSGEHVLLVDDLIATGGTAEAALKLIDMAGGSVVGCAFVIDLPDLGGRAKLERAGFAVLTLCEFVGD